MIRFQCPTCRKVLKAPDDAVGRKGTCSRCGQRLKIPAEIGGKTAPAEPLADDSNAKCISSQLLGQSTTAGLTTNCPHCGRSGIRYELHEANVVLECAKCGGRFTPLGGAVGTVSVVPERTAEAASTSRDSVFKPNINPAGRRPSSVAMIVAGMALLSVLWLWAATELARGPHWNGSPATFKSYLHLLRAYNGLDQSLAQFGISASELFIAVLCLSLAASLFLLGTSFYCWERQPPAGRIMSVGAIILLFPSICCGVVL